MNYSTLFLLLNALLISGTSIASQIPNEASKKPNPYYIIAMPAISENFPFGKRERVFIKLFKRFGALAKEIGCANCSYDPEDKTAFLSIFLIQKNEIANYREQGLGSHLFKRSMAHLKETVDCTTIHWTAIPLDSANQNSKGLARLVAFYCNAGAIDSGRNKKDSTKMLYPLPSAQMLTVLMPILEPEPVSKQDKEIILANGKPFIPSPSDALGIIANYMGETND